VPGFNGGKEEAASSNTVSPDFFKTLQVPVVLGRDFESRDDRTLREPKDRAGRVVIVNQAFARKFFGQENPIGRRTNMGEVIGVVRDMRDSGLRQVEPTYYAPYQFGWAGRRVVFTIRVSGSPSAIAPSIREAVRQVDSKMPVEGLGTKEEAIRTLFSQERFFAQLAAFLALLAAGLVCLGSYGLLAFSVAQRTAEIGIRMALGAQPTRVLRMVLSESLAVVAVGVVMGLGCAALATQVIASVLYGLTTSDPLTYGAVAALFGAVAAVASLLPARRAARIDPVIALRSE
jgi:predicted permease